MKKTGKLTALFAALLILLGAAAGCAASAASQHKLGAQIESRVSDAAVADASICLKDDWHVYADYSDIGEGYEWYCGFLGKGATVSLPYESSSLCYTSVVWFSNIFTPQLEMVEGQRIIAHFEGLQYQAKIWLNGNFIGEHEGSYGKFSFDVTDFVRNGEENLLAIRLCAPKNGDTLRGLTAVNLPMWLGGFQHIQTPVYLSVVPETAIADSYVSANYADGTVNVEVTLDNPGDKAVQVDIHSQITPDAGSAVLDRASATVSAAPGLSKHTLTLTVADFHAWSPDDPYLYNVNIRTRQQGAAYADSSSVTTGFKTLTVDGDGSFMLNGERIFIKCTHMSCYVFGSVDVGAEIADQIKQVDYLKSCGFNMIRLLDGPAIPELLDYCDRIGLLVYEETAMSWTQEDCSSTKELFEREVQQLLERDRNHVSFSIIGMLNETTVTANTEDRFAAAVGSLAVVREWHSPVLALLSSGRWDYDLQYGSASNPGSLTWDGLMGNEGGEAASSDFQFGGIGDVHFYPQMPYDAETRAIYELIGGDRLAFLSEAGAGSQSNVVSGYRLLEQEHNRDIGNGMCQSAGKQVITLYSLYDRFNMSRVFSSPEDIIIESQRLQSSQRALIADYVRSNRRINGYSVTMGADVGFRGEGLLESTMDLKSGMFAALTDSWAPLRFCLNIDEYNLYNDQTLDVDIRLSDLGILEDKDYEATVRVTGENGTVYTKQVTVHPEYNDKGRAFLSVTVLKESIPLTGLTSGEYKLSATLAGESAGGGEKIFWVNEKKDLPRTGETIYHSGMSDAAVALLEEQGATVMELDPENIPAGATVFLANRNVRQSTLEALWKSVSETGTHVIGLNPEAFGDWGYTNLPFEEKGMIGGCNNWLYHFDSVVFDTALTKGLENNCLMDPLCYGSVFPTKYYSQITMPDEMSVLPLFIGNDGGVTEQALEYGVQLGSYAYGSGWITLNTFNINDSIGNPVADMLLMNMANYRASK